MILSELDDGVFVQNQVVFTKFDIYVFITVTVDISAGELLVFDGIIRHVVSGSVLTRRRLLQNQAVRIKLDIYASITINIHGDRMLHMITYIYLHVYLSIDKY